MVSRRFSLHWEVGPVSVVNLTPVEFVPAQVPGAVQLDWARAHDTLPGTMPDGNYDDLTTYTPAGRYPDPWEKTSCHQAAIHNPWAIDWFLSSMTVVRYRS